MSARPFTLAVEAVSPVVGVLLTVAITVGVGAIVFLVSSGYGEDEGLKPQISFYTEDLRAPGGILTVVTITNGPVPMSSLAISGTSHAAQACTWSHTTGNLAPGDQLSCGAVGTLVITDSTHQVLLYSSSFS